MTTRGYGEAMEQGGFVTKLVKAMGAALEREPNKRRMLDIADLSITRQATQTKLRMHACAWS